MASTDKTRKRSVKQHNFNLKKSSFPQFSRLNSGFPFCLKRKTHIQIVAAEVGNLGLFTVGFCFSLSSYAIPQLLVGEGGGIQLDDEECSWFASSHVLGCVIGSVIGGGYLVERIGSRKSLMVDCLGYIIGSLLVSLTNSLPLILLGRIITGYSTGSNYVSVPVFVGEISHPSIRGFTGSLFIINHNIGFTLSMILGASLPWRTVVLISMIPPSLSFCLLLFIKDSPSWLLRRRNESGAKQALMFYSDTKPETWLEAVKGKENGESIIMQEKYSIVKSKFYSAKLTGRRALDSSFLKPFFVLNLMLTIGINWGGFAALEYYMHTIVSEVQVPFNTYWIGVIITAYGALVPVLLSLALDKLRRRPLYLFSGSLVAAALAIQAGYAWCSPYINPEIKTATNWIPFLAILLQCTGYGLGYGVIVFNLQGEILPSDMRSFGSGLLGIFDNISLFIALKTVPLMIDSIGVGGMFSTYFGFVILTLITAYFIMPETKGLSLEEIEDMYQPKKK
ncbi:solute carrier family 2, facilitated glucose transporter member 8 [Eurytemora carolleeae]|uniref:solute carrier family 2, facilitated glucose transporter member 8 n=1 Tax=Eurytemora carolleeae TaxID=1294199 RepID=UPI000C769FFE|nr:solute carrier family 2, facilitated glucose transporter member 8 [Eurytemora carolleeae]|eukprot:XP_023347909.1 solute carrier family 2, facilitated glucose transporter member 8-like [Eurytemora affinis]